MTSGILVRLGLDPYSDRGPIVPDLSPSKTLPLRPTIPVVAMLLSVCGATAVFAAILWQFLEHRAQHRFAFESKNVATGLEKRVADAMDDLRQHQHHQRGNSAPLRRGHSPRWLPRIPGAWS